MPNLYSTLGQQLIALETLEEAFLQLPKEYLCYSPLKLKVAAITCCSTERLPGPFKQKSENSKAYIS
jgi:hypothetical protein